MNYQENIRNFYTELLQGEDPKWLLTKYGFDSLLSVNESGSIEADSAEGRILLQRMINTSPVEIISAKKSQKENPKSFPWDSKFTVSD